jgi:hypothetical protein
LTFSLSDAMRIAMIRPPKPESSMSTAGACADWELVLHAFFDGEWMRRFAGLRAATRAMQTLLRRNERSEIDEAETQAFRHRVGCA